MNKNKMIAIAVTLGVFFGPFYQLFITNNGSNIVNSSREIFLMLGWIVGMIVAFWIAVNEPFGKKQTVAEAREKMTAEKSKAA